MKETPEGGGLAADNDCTCVRSGAIKQHCFLGGGRGAGKEGKGERK